MVLEEKQCRLCWGEEDDGPLVQPCACRGSAKWIHQHCLEQWRRTGPYLEVYDLTITSAAAKLSTGREGLH